MRFAIAAGKEEKSRKSSAARARFKLGFMVVLNIQPANWPARRSESIGGAMIGEWLLCSF